jgi:hypothetical protein
MIRKTIIVVLTLAAIGMALAWATSFDDVNLQAHMGGYDSRVITVDSSTALYLTSARGWMRAGVLRMDRDMQVPPVDGNAGAFWAGIVANPEPRFQGKSRHRSPLGGLLIIRDYVLSYYRLKCVAMPHWALCAALLGYPALAFIRGPVRRYRRRCKGLCVRCGYDLTGNVSGICPECGTEREHQ